MRSAVQTYSGALVDLHAPKSETIRLEDIAHHLSLQCRFNGATRQFYSVAQHSVHVLEIVRLIPMLERNNGVSLDLGLIALQPHASREELTWALLHDAGEAFVGDVVSPVRAMLHGAHHEVERRILDRIMTDLGMGLEMPELVRVADELALASEARDLLVGGPTWPTRPCAWIPTVKPWSPKKARRRFLEEARVLGVVP